MSTGRDIYGPRDPAERRNPRERRAAEVGQSKPQPFQPTEAEQDLAEENPRTRLGVEVGRAIIALLQPSRLSPFPFDPAAPSPDGVPGEIATPPLFVTAPRTFEELQFAVSLVSVVRETPVVVEQTIAAGATGSITVTIPANEVDIQRFFDEAGDGSVEYSIDVQSAGQTASATHRITGGKREFAHYWEKTVQVIIDFTNTDLVNPALIQIVWTAIRIDIPKWLPYRNNVIALHTQLGIEP